MDRIDTLQDIADDIPGYTPTLDEVMAAVRELLPHAETAEDNDGQLVIYTGLYQTEDGYARPEDTTEDDDDTPEPFDTVGFIMAYESGELDEDDIIAGFQRLIDAGTIGSLQGSYQRTASALIEAGRCTA